MRLLHSMTGVGQATRTIPGCKLQVDIKSVNHRYLEITVRMPREWLMLENPLRKLAQQAVKRGRIDIFVNIDTDGHGGQNVQVNWPLLEGMHSAVGQIRERLSMSDDDNLTLRDYAAMPDMFVPAESNGHDTETIVNELENCLRDALAQLVAMREAEGRHLHDDLLNRLRTISALCDSARQAAPEAIYDYREKMRNRIFELLEDRTHFDEQRFAMEVAAMAERIDITEELTRLFSHCQQFEQLLAAEEPVGRRMDFLIQEMNREINTIGSKSNHMILINSVVELKAELEKMREQVQNIE